MEEIWSDYNDDNIQGWNYSPGNFRFISNISQPLFYYRGGRVKHIQNYSELYKINKKQEVGLKVVSSQIDAFGIEMKYINKNSSESKNEIGIEYSIVKSNIINEDLDNPLKQPNTALSKNQILDKIKFDRILNFINPISIGYGLVQRNYLGPNWKINHSIQEASEYEYLSLSDDLSNLKLNKKKKMEVIKSLNQIDYIKSKNKSLAENFFRGDLDKKWDGHLKNNIFPYSKLNHIFNLTMVFSKEKLSTISEFKLKKIDK